MGQEKLNIEQLLEENEKLKADLESYKKWYYEKIDAVNEMKELLNHLKGLIKIYVK